MHTCTSNHYEWTFQNPDLNKQTAKFRSHWSVRNIDKIRNSKHLDYTRFSATNQNLSDLLGLLRAFIRPALWAKDRKHDSRNCR